MTEYIAQPQVEEPQAVVGVLAQFDGVEPLKKAAANIRDAGFRRWDVHSPFPVHGIERAMGMRRTPLPWLVLLAGCGGAVVALLLQWWTNGFDYPIVTSGKPLFSLPANIPITFELIVLFSGLVAFGGTLVLNLLPHFNHPVFRSERFRRATTDGFFISIEAADAKFDEAAVRTLLESAGATAVEVLQDTTAKPKFPTWLYKAGIVAVVLGLLPPVLVAWYRATPKSLPRIHIIPDMDFQEKYTPQAASPLPAFADGSAARPPVPGTVYRGGLEDEHFDLGRVGGKPATMFPMPVTDELMQRGQQRFGIFCATCHGLAGEGGETGLTSLRAGKRKELDWVLPASLLTSGLRDQPVGQIFDTMTNGLRKMPALGPQIPPQDRWAIILYLRALQRSQNAALDDVPEEMRDKLR
jgi:mono/diheme cytochrome c family protein